MTKTDESSKNPDEIWQQFMAKDAELEKLLDERANVWAAITKIHSPDERANKEPAVIEMIEKEMNPEIDRLSGEVKELLNAYNMSKDSNIK